MQSHEERVIFAFVFYLIAIILGITFIVDIFIQFLSVKQVGILFFLSVYSYIRAEKNMKEAGKFF